jgi:glycerol dehydrogenase-like iron-containing ADH family enzyme
MAAKGGLFTTVYGRNLVGELRHFCHRPYLVVTMADLWAKLEDLFDDNMAGVHLVKSLEHRALEEQVAVLPACSSVVGLGGGQALDVAKYISWSLRLPLFQVPTAMTVDAAFGQRIAVRFGGRVRYIGWAVPEAVYVDYDVIQGAPAQLNRSGVGDVLCFHTAHYDWKLAHDRGKTRPQWPYDEGLVAEAREVLNGVLGKLDEIRQVTEEGIRALTSAHRYGGGTYHRAGWNPRHVEGVEHFFFYALEYLTRRPFIHGQPVSLGVYIGSAMQENEAEAMLEAIHRAGVDIRPEAMGVTWDDVAQVLHGLRTYVEQAGLWYTIANEVRVSDNLLRQIRSRVEDRYGPWTGQDVPWQRDGG